VEELKDTGSSASSSLYGTDDEGLSGEASDLDGKTTGTGELGASGASEKIESTRNEDFEMPSDEIKQRIIAQV